MANAQDTNVQTELETPLAQPTAQSAPTPTIYLQPTSVPLKTATTSISFPPPTPTIFIAPQQPTNTPTPMPTSQQIVTPTELTTISPTDTPTPTVTLITTAQPTAQGPTGNESLFSEYSSQYGVSEDELKKIAQCESGFNTHSDTGTYAGMFQFSASTWASVRGLMGLDPNPDLRKNAEESIHTTAFMLARGEESAWPNCH